MVSTWGEEDKEGSHAVTFLGSVPKGSRARVGRLGVCGGGVVMCQTMDKNVQMLRIRSKEEAVKKMRRRLKRAREKGTAEKGAADTVRSTFRSDLWTTTTSTFCFGLCRSARQTLNPQT